ncbi:DUF3068 domain-containing protein [Nocardioides sp.]|uniref:DUF3068 domain-containing protein n=1 Tax=Nocardioides sp. TaxID=35761 RepID=UPI003528ED48
MRRIVGLVLLGLAAFLLTMGALVKWYAYPRLAVVPLDQDSVSMSVGENMTYFDTGTLSEQTDTLTSTLRTIGDVKASEDQGDNTAVWDQSTTTTRSSDGVAISVGTIRAAFDRTTGSAVDCCDANIDDEPVTYDGNIFKFPFNSPKDDSVMWWDEDLKSANPMTFEGEEEVLGLNTYKYSQSIAPTQIGTINVPPSVLGETGDEVLTADMYFGVDRTYWVEPETGVIMKAQTSPNQTLRYNGEDRVVATRGTTVYPDSQVQDNIDEYQPLGSQLHLLRVVLPLVGLIVGLLALVVGALLVLGSRGRDEEPAAEEPAADEDTADV